MIKSLHCITSEVYNFPYCDGLGDINTLIKEYEEQVLECQRLLALDIALRSTPAKWWGMYKNNIGTL